MVSYQQFFHNIYLGIAQKFRNFSFIIYYVISFFKQYFIACYHSFNC